MTPIVSPQVMKGVTQAIKARTSWNLSLLLCQLLETCPVVKLALFHCPRATAPAAKVIPENVDWMTKPMTRKGSRLKPARTISTVMKQSVKIWIWMVGVKLSR